MKRLKRAAICATPLLALSAALACQSSHGVPSRGTTHVSHAVEGLAPAECAEVWVSYQLRVAEVNGEVVDYGAETPSLYWCLTLPAGAHELGLRLDYASMTHEIRTTGVLRQGIRLEGERAYRLIDIAAGTPGERTLRPWLVQGAPEPEELELRGPGALAGGAADQ